ncbi:MAG: hypothetical protein M1481_04000 [Candidatus Thermoplasmatota archaeon]|jgi:bifunctional DNase/RNase|nr:hypothetical protein [Candidatus Thermoplasmatota archaeon]MCL5963327.1 hypothetical protein [Candidatus Thermoplasmatota archaeon]
MQIQFIKNLQNTDKKMELARKYLIDLNKKILEELTNKEASVLIDRLRS